MVGFLDLRPEFAGLAVGEKAAQEGFAGGVASHQLGAAGGVSLGVVVDRGGHAPTPDFAFITSQGVGPLRHSQVASS